MIGEEKPRMTYEEKLKQLNKVALMWIFVGIMIYISLNFLSHPDWFRYLETIGFLALGVMIVVAYFKIRRTEAQ